MFACFVQIMFTRAPAVAFSGNMQFIDWTVQARTEYGLRIGQYTTLAWIAQSVNCYIALKAMCYLL